MKNELTIETLIFFANRHQIVDVVVEGVVACEAPEYPSAFLASASLEYNGTKRPLTEGELYDLSETEWFAQQVEKVAIDLFTE